MSIDPTFDIGSRTLRVAEFKAPNPLQDEYNEYNVGEVTTDLAEATIVSSDMVGDPYFHQPVIDFDIPVRLVPSSTPGHSHLYIDQHTGKYEYFRLLDALVECGYVQWGYAEAAKRRGHSDVRLPWVRKQAAQA